MKFRRVPKGVELVRQAVEEIYRVNNRLPPDDLALFARIWIEVESVVLSRIKLDEEEIKRFVRGLVYWYVFEKKGSIKRVYDKVMDYLDKFEIGRETDMSFKREFLSAYKQYVWDRWRLKLKFDVDRDTSPYLQKALDIAREIIEKEGITCYEYIKRQHECWDKIKFPLSMKSLADEVKCIRRNMIYNDVRKLGSKITSDYYKEGMVARMWEQVLKVGVDNYLSELSGEEGDCFTLFIKDMIKRYIEDREKLDKDQLSAKYSPSRVQRVWEETYGSVV